MRAPEPTLLRLLVETTAAVEARLRARLAERGHAATRAQLDLVRRLDADGTRVTELARRTGTRRQSVTETATALAQAGLVEVTVDPTDRRARVVRPTAAAHTAVAEAATLLTDIETGLVEAGVDVPALRRTLTATLAEMNLRAV
jgi:DNA-binding MarR family transcriptional regulator